ncbi:hypothetical protein ABZ897_22885 [Nonomuraea sp. NPDC046802]|uniref:hypothetical protein n=1 Tax=Nonomuraea sp. NPDC046802 TaxID=3154919 RepID=UPI0033C5E629
MDLPAQAMRTGRGAAVTHDAAPLPRGIGLPSALNPELGTVSLRPGDRIVVLTGGALKALGAPRLTDLIADGTSPVALRSRFRAPALSRPG